MYTTTDRDDILAHRQALHQEAIRLDAQDPLASFRDQFYIPRLLTEPNSEVDLTYLVGNSLGLQPKRAYNCVQHAMDSWATLAVEGHFSGTHPYMTYHRLCAAGLAELVGAAEDEVVAMNGLTTNLHLMLASFYKPVGTRTKILMEAGAFPSDQYAVETHLRWHGLDPAEHIIEVTPAVGSRILTDEAILAAIAAAGDTLALVLFSGVQYATGQVFDMASIVKAGHAVGAYVGFDLAHAIGNIRLELNTWGADFACWCTYKYLNSGPGGIAGVFVHNRHADRKDLVRLGGWWGHNEAERFLMRKGFDPMPGAQGWQHSNAPILLLATLRASLSVVADAGWDNILTKKANMNAFMLQCLQQPGLEQVTILTPQPAGCQFSLVVPGGKQVFHTLRAAGVLGDWREPDIIRLSPVPLYNTYQDIAKATTTLADVLESQLS